MATARITIAGEDKLKSPLKQAQQELQGFEGVASKVGDTLKKAFTVGAIIKGVQELSRAVAACVNEFKQSVEVETRLDAVIKATGQQYKYTTKDIKEYASSLQEMTRFGDDAIQSAAQLLVATKKFDKEGLERTLALSADLAEAMGTDITSAASTLSKALIEPGEGLTRLKTIGISFTTAEEEMITKLREAGDELGAQQMIIEKVESSYKGVAESIGSVNTSTLDKIKNTWGDLKEGIGKAFADRLEGIFNWVYKTLKWLERLVNQTNQRRDFNTAMAGGDIQGLADNFTEEYLKGELAKVEGEYNQAILTLTGEYLPYINKLWNQEQISMTDFIRMSVDEQNAALEKILRPIGDEGVWRGMMEAADDTYQYLTILAALEKQQQDLEEHQFKWEQQQAQEAAAQEAAAQEAAAAEMAAKITSELENMIKKYGSQSDTYTVGNLQKEIETTRRLLNEDVEQGSEDYKVLEDILAYLLSQLPKEMTKLGLSNTMTASTLSQGINGFITQSYLGTGISDSTYMSTMFGEVGMWVQTTQAFMDVFTDWESDFDEFVRKFGEPNRQSGLGFNFGIESGDFGLTNSSLDFSSTMSLLGPNGVKNLGIDSKTIYDGLTQYGSLSKTLKIDNLNEEIERLTTLQESTDGQMFVYYQEMIDGLNDQLKELTKIEKDQRTFLDKIGEKVGTAVGSLFGADEDQSKAAGSAIINSFTSQMGEAGEVVSRLATNMATMGPVLGAIVTALHYVIGGLMETLQDVFNDFIAWGIEPLKEFGRMIGQILLPIFEEIMPSVVATGKVLMNLFGAIARLLTPIVEILMRVIGPVLTVLADILVSIVGTISWAIDWIAYCITWVLNKVSFGWIDQTARPGSLNSYLEGMYSNPAESYSATGAGSVGATNASYSGGTVVHLNVYQNGVVCGDNGIQEFAIMLKKELQDVAYYSR